MVEAKKIELILQELIRRANRSDRRLRIVEQRIQAIESRVSSAEDTTFKQIKDIKKGIIDFEILVKSMNDRLVKIENDISKISDQTKSFAKRNEIKEIETMFDLINPIKHDFVTRKELNEILSRRSK